MGDKERDFVGSNQWIGAVEVAMCVTYFTNDLIDCKIINVARGAELVAQAQELRSHFLTHGTPIMIGGDVYAHTILGVDIRPDVVDWEAAAEADESSDPVVMFLILDPHFKGQDSNLKTITSKGWCQWKDPRKFFRQDVFYNLCLPQVPITEATND